MAASNHPDVSIRLKMYFGKGGAGEGKWIRSEQLARAFGMKTTPSVTKAIRKLEQQGWVVERRKDGNELYYHVSPQQKE